LIVRHAWIALVGRSVPRTDHRSSSPKKVSRRTRLPDGAACHAMPGSNQTVGDPRSRSAALWADQFRVR
jgi:hypothetical protein